MKCLLKVATCGVGLLVLYGEMAFSAAPDLYTLPEWHRLDTVHRHYEEDVKCVFSAEVTQAIPRLVLRRRYVESTHKLEKEFVRSEATLGKSLSSAFSACRDEIQTKIKAGTAIRGRCLLQSCSTARSRQIDVDSDLLSQAISFQDDKVKSELANPPVYSTDDHFVLYSRPNDDAFQNAAGEEENGEPYEVAVMYSGITGKKNEKTNQLELTFDWRAEITTGRQVESGNYICFHEAKTDVPGEKQQSVLGQESSEKWTRVLIQYPRGVVEASGFESKVGAVLHASLPLGSVKDGEYSGQLLIRNIKPGQKPPPPGQAKPTLGSKIKFIDWSVKVVDQKIVHADINITRSHPVPPLHLVRSNIYPVDISQHDNQHYPQQARRAICKKETVGDGDLGIKETESDILARKVGNMVVRAGCLDCHGEGAAALFRFCDDGVSLRPKEDAQKIMSMIVHGVPEKKYGVAGGYPEDMVKAVVKLQELEKEMGLIREWASKL